ncbi:hypothetical protein SCLCIDRAFT_111016 [Scleroderma citrinum Foug A]|uniref:Uncharacterized protein n=1 Tax=Scleroderma citrinum Foug A TaxID=1036808 RepID=A0A0C3EDA7_9AGAM|nr:hypothetical protein SCLCIDRAFT_111016 [Scleroderma citrinum Foug A]
MFSRSSASGPAPPSRRSSVIPPRAPSATGAPIPPKTRAPTLFSAFTGATTAPKPAAPVSDVNSSVRPSVISPSGSAASSGPRHRATISEAAKKGPSTTSRLTNQPAVGGGPARAMRTVGSISSIREVDNGKVSELQEKLQEAQDSILEKTEAVARLEQQISELQASLDTASADAKAKGSTIEELQETRQASEVELAALRASLRQLETERAHDLNSLDALKEELNIVKQAGASQTMLMEKLQEQVTTLTTEIAIAQENFESLRRSSDQSSAEAAAAAQTERESFLRAKADLDALNAEIEVLRTAHDTALQDATNKLSESQQHASRVSSLITQIEALKAEREESANTISELEIKVLEMNESQEKAEDEYNNLLARLKGVEVDLAQAIAAKEQIVQDAETKEEEGAQQIAELKQSHAVEIQSLRDELAATVTRMENLKTDLAALEDAHEKTKKQAEATAEEHERQLEESEQSYISKHIEFSEEIKKLTAELEGQEAKYNEKVEAVKAEHDLLLQEAFERAKGEAAELHGQDLQALRAESQATIEQLRAAHQSFVSNLQAEQQATLESEVAALEQKLSSQGLELRATQDDLTKTKSALEAAHLASEDLGSQLDDAQAAVVAASASADQAAEIERLTKQLASMRDESTMLNDVLEATKESLSEMSANHNKELEEAAKGRAEEVTRLRAEHEGQVSLLAAQKSELSLSLGDLENEVAMLKAQLSSVELSAVPRSNGAASSSTTNVTREELQKVHEAHNLKMHDLQADHERAVRDFKFEIETLQNRLEEVQSDLARKNMEIQYLEQEQEESQDSITRYVKVFGLQSLFGVVIALAVIFDFI